MALWKARALSPEQKVQIVEAEAEAKNLQMAEEDSIGSDFQAADDDSEGKSLQSEESGSFVGMEDTNMSIVYSSVLSVPVSISSAFKLSLSHLYLYTYNIYFRHFNLFV